MLEIQYDFFNSSLLVRGIQKYNYTTMNIRLNILLAASAILSTTLLFGCGGDKIVVGSDNNVNPISDINPTLNVYIENSGSMDGYMCDGSQLKDAVFDYVSDLSVCSDTTSLNYINNRIIPYKGSLEQYIKTMSPTTFQKAGGNHSNSDLGEMLSMILQEMTDTSVSIFISDCILDLPVSNSQKFLSRCQISIKNAINEGRNRIPNLGVEIIKMTSDFNGKYYYPNGGVEKLKDVKRPYYIWIFGNNNILAKLNSVVPVNELKDFGFEGIVAYSKKVAEPYEIKNRSLTSTTINPTKGNYNATIRVNLSSTLQPETVIQDLSNYTFNNQSLVIEDIKPITASNSPYTHFINIVIPKGVNIAEDNLILKTPQMPDWVIESNDDSGIDINDNLNKTTGIKYLIIGVADAYKKDKVLTSLRFTVKRK